MKGNLREIKREREREIKKIEEKFSKEEQGIIVNFEDNIKKLKIDFVDFQMWHEGETAKKKREIVDAIMNLVNYKKTLLTKYSEVKKEE